MPATSPVLGEELRGAVHHRADRARQQDVPEERAEHVAMGRDQRMRDRHPAELVDRQLADREVRVALADPALQGLSRAFGVARGERELDLGERMAELPEADRVIEHQHVQRQHRQHTDQLQQHLREPDADDGDAHRQTPAEGAMAPLAGVGRTCDRVGDRACRAVHAVVSRQREHLLEHERQDQCDEAHGGMIPTPLKPRRTGRGCAASLR